jgi:hypothetical protein
VAHRRCRIAPYVYRKHTSDSAHIDLSGKALILPTPSHLWRHTNGVSLVSWSYNVLTFIHRSLMRGTILIALECLGLKGQLGTQKVRDLT